MQNSTQVRVYRPELIPRRGEAIAWSGTLLTGLIWIVLALIGNRIVSMIPILLVLLLFSATIISLGNWVDRQTEMKLSGEGVEYRNGLRHIRLSWAEIREVRVTPGRWGEKIQVYGEQGYFGFHTLGEVKLRGELRGSMGFEKGDEILRQIILNSGLQIVDRPGDGYYYARE